MGKSDFISQMVEDTIADSESSNSSTVLPFESPKNSPSFIVDYDDARKCYILQSEEGCIEVPKNWGPFNNRISNEFSLSVGEDKYLFLEILSVFSKKTITHAKFTINLSATIEIAA